MTDAPVYADGTIAWDDAETWIYEPGSFRPMAKLAGDDLYYVVTDHLGTPRELLTEDGAKAAWRAKIGLWGAVEGAEYWGMTAANRDEPPVTCNLRFQGQWFDEESGLHYNRFRYYDPAATQYLSSDPIGLAGGVRPQGYVSDPNGWVDPLGLAGCPPNVANGRAEGTHKQLTANGYKDSHHIIQDAAVRDIPGYNRNDAPTIQLEGPSNRVGTEHHAATQAQRRSGGGTYAAERRMGYRALREAGISRPDARRNITRADDYFKSIGVNGSTPTRVPGNRAK